MVRHPTTAHRIEDLLARGLEAGANALSGERADRVATRIGRFVHWPLTIRRGTVEANLRRAFPSASEDSMRATMQAAYEHLAREAVATMRFSRLPASEIISRTEIVGWEQFLGSLESGRGAILATGHFGNWEIGGAAIAARGVPTSAIVKRLSNPLVNARLEATRLRLGVEPIDKGAAPRLVPRALRAGRVIGIVADQDASDAGIWVPFLGQPSSTHRGPALFSLRLGAPLYFAAALRLPGPRPRYRIDLELVQVQRSSALASDVARLTAELAKHLEKAVRAAPEQYFWFHRRWKTAIPTELDQPTSGTTPSGGEAVQLGKPA